MRFISQYPGYGAQIRQQRQEGRGDGTVEILTPGLYVTFASIERGAFIYENELAAALKHFNFRGNTQHIDQATPTDPVNRLSVCDTEEMALSEGWSAEDKMLVESRLQEIALTTPEEILYVESTPIAAPFPNYDAYEGEPTALVLKLIEDGFDLDRVLEYERIFGPKRPFIIEELEEAIEARKSIVIQA